MSCALQTGALHRARLAAPLLQQQHRRGYRAAAAPRCRVLAAASAQATQALAFHIDQTTLAFPLRAEEAKRLSEALTSVMQTFADKQEAQRPKRLPSLEYIFKGDVAAGEVEYFEVFCNTNAHATAFDARVLLTLRTAGGLRVTTEGKLTGVKADVEDYLTQLGA